jgi:hypothetical protein
MFAGAVHPSRFSLKTLNYCAMKVTDINGKEIEITHLDGAIELARLYSSFNTTNGSIDFLLIQKKYWNDLLAKLENLQEEQNDQVNKLNMIKGNDITD